MIKESRYFSELNTEGQAKFNANCIANRDTINQ